MCGITTLFKPRENVNTTLHVIEIAGDYTTSGLIGGGNLDPQWTRLSTSTNSDDRDKEGIRLKMGGGYHGKKKQKAVVEFLCKRDNNDDKEESQRSLSAREGEEDNKDSEERRKKEQTDDGEDGVLKFVRYDSVGEDEVLALKWETKYACEDHAKGSGESSSGHWGFFTWFIIM